MAGYAAILNQPLQALVNLNTFTGPSDFTSTTTQPPLVLPANFLKKGMILHMTASGTFSTTGTPTFVVGPYYGSTVLGVNVAFTTASGAATLPWHMETWTQIFTDGSAGTAWTDGSLTYGTTFTAVTTIPIPGIAQAAVAVDTTAATALTMKATCSASSGSNIWICYKYVVECLNLTP